MTTESPAWPWVDLPPGPDATPSPAAAHRYISAPTAPTTLPSGHEVPLLARYDDVRTALACPAASRIFGPDDPPMVAGVNIDSIPHVLLNMDPPEHTRLRRIVSGPFAPRQVERWRPAIASIAGDLLDRVDGSFDLVADYALPLSTRAICGVLGVPADDQDRFREWTAALLSTSPDDEQARGKAFVSLLDYATCLVAQHRAHPEEDLIDLLINARDQHDRLTEDELISMVLTLVVAGHETLVVMISRAVYRLLHTGSYAQLAADPSLIPSAVEEVLRYDAPGNYGLLRRITEDTLLPSGAKIPAGTVVLPSTYLADHDPAAFPDPDRFDIARHPNRHLGFGHGAHLCLGAHLARMELQEALRALTVRLPRLAPEAALATLPWTEDGLNYRPRHLPVTTR
ncbi:MAG TPA: cytochrome P450 [Nonomuraea sp.]|nr:cytochrome P450 [Nonomuraea sp.]